MANNYTVAYNLSHFIILLSGKKIYERQIAYKGKIKIFVLTKISSRYQEVAWRAFENC